MSALRLEHGTFGVDEIDALDAFLTEHGFAIVRGCFGTDERAAIERECVAAQAQVAAGVLDPRGHGLDRPPVTMPLGFEKVPGEIAVYAEPGDVIFHDAYLWHAAARGTDDDARRRHVRGGWFSGAGKLRGEHLDDFVKNAAR